MDESWRASIGSIIPRRRSTEETRRRRGRWADSSSDSALGPDDFHDVFGGPPRTVLLHRFSGELHAPGDPKPGNFYDELFRPADRQRRIPRPAADERGIQGFGSRARARMVKIEEGFYDDIFGSESIGDRRSKSKSSSSVLSSEDVGPPIWAASSMAEDAILSSFTSKLRYSIKLLVSSNYCNIISLEGFSEPKDCPFSSKTTFERMKVNQVQSVTYCSKFSVSSNLSSCRC